MIKTRNCTSLLAILLTTLFVQPLWAGVVFEVETTYHSNSGWDSRQGTETSVMSVDRPNLKMQVPSGTSSDESADEMLYLGKRSEIVMVDHSERTYVVMDQNTMKEVGGQVNDQMAQAMKQMEKQLEGLDPKQREMVEKMMKDRMPPGMMGNAPKPVSNEFNRTGERATKAGYPCVRYDVLRNGEKISEMWVTNWGDLEGGDEAKDVFLDIASFFEEMMESMSEMMGGSGFGGNENMFDGFKKIDGFPVVTRSFEDGELESETTLKSARRQTLDPAAFEPPSGYKRRTMLGGQ